VRQALTACEAKTMIELLYRRLYETERKLPNRNFAKDHSYEEWREWHCGAAPRAAERSDNSISQRGQ